jgi:hypothetical protein
MSFANEVQIIRSRLRLRGSAQPELEDEKKDLATILMTSSFLLEEREMMVTEALRAATNSTAK